MPLKFKTVEVQSGNGFEMICFVESKRCLCVHACTEQRQVFFAQTAFAGMNWGLWCGGWSQLQEAQAELAKFRCEAANLVRATQIN
jgi:hypothetical protein